MSCHTGRISEFDFVPTLVRDGDVVLGGDRVLGLPDVKQLRLDVHDEDLKFLAALYMVVTLYVAAIQDLGSSTWRALTIADP